MKSLYELPLESLEIVAFDTETTGLNEGSRLVELGGLRFQGKILQKEFPSTLINPEMPIPPRSTAVHKITDAMVAGQPTAEPVLRNFFDFSQGAVLLAHNANFDRMMVHGEVKRLGIPLSEWPMMDTHVLAKLWVLDMPNYRLETLAKHFELKFATLHRAYEDAKIVMELFQKIYDIAKEKMGKSLTVAEFMKGKEFLYLSNS